MTNIVAARRGEEVGFPIIRAGRTYTIEAVD